MGDTLFLGGGLAYQGAFIGSFLAHIVNHVGDVPGLEAWVSPEQQRRYEDQGQWYIGLGLDGMVALDGVMLRFDDDPPGFVRGWSPETRAAVAPELAELRAVIARRIEQLRAGAPPGADWYKRG